VTRKDLAQAKRSASGTRFPALDRRAFLRAGVIGAAGGLAEILDGGRAPARAQTTKLHLLHPISFIPESDAELRRQLAEYERRMRLAVTLETINLNDLQPRITAAIQSGVGGRHHLDGPQLAAPLLAGSG
jgi:hypothetical protein